METRELVQTALLIAACAALGYIMILVPNIELISAAIFTSGVLTGARRGVIIGLLAETIYAGLNPQGVSAPPLFLAQIVGMGVIGAAGGAFGRLVRGGRWSVVALGAGVSGFVLTLFFDVLTSSAAYLNAREFTTWGAMVLGGLTFPFPLAHALGNTLGFALIVPAVGKAMQRRSVA